MDVLEVCKNNKDSIFMEALRILKACKIEISKEFCSEDDLIMAKMVCTSARKFIAYAEREI